MVDWIVQNRLMRCFPNEQEGAVRPSYPNAEEAKLAGGEDRIKKQHEAGKYTARERIEKLLDPDSTLTSEDYHLLLALKIRL